MERGFLAVVNKSGVCQIGLIPCNAHKVANVVRPCSHITLTLEHIAGVLRGVAHRTPPPLSPPRFWIGRPSKDLRPGRLLPCHVRARFVGNTPGHSFAIVLLLVTRYHNLINYDFRLYKCTKTTIKSTHTTRTIHVFGNIHLKINPRSLYSGNSMRFAVFRSLCLENETEKREPFN